MTEQFGREIHDVRSGKLLGSKKGDKSSGLSEYGADEGQAAFDAVVDKDVEVVYRQSIDDGPGIILTGKVPGEFDVPGVVQVSRPDSDGSTDHSTRFIGSMNKTKNGYMIGGDADMVAVGTDAGEALKNLVDLQVSAGSYEELYSTRRAVALGGKPVQFGREIHDVRSGKLLGSKKGDGGGREMVEDRKGRPAPKFGHSEMGQMEAEVIGKPRSKAVQIVDMPSGDRRKVTISGTKDGAIIETQSAGGRPVKGELTKVSSEGRRPASGSGSPKGQLYAVTLTVMDGSTDQGRPKESKFVSELGPALETAVSSSFYGLHGPGLSERYPEDAGYGDPLFHPTV